MSKALLLLEDGSIFEGESLGKIGTTLGEICFNTGMTGYSHDLLQKYPLHCRYHCKNQHN